MDQPKKTSTLPKFRSDCPRFYICDYCNALLIGSSRVGHGNSELAPSRCCGQPMRELVPRQASDASDELVHRPMMTITGGFEHNTVVVHVGADPRHPHPMTSDHYVDWIWLRSFEGGHLKYLNPGQDPEASFALSDEDAFGYCDQPICKMGRGHCMFQCKRGYAAYAHCTKHGLWMFIF
ncbi:desulfoferrodoxin family protein [Telmatospirillum sp.]|uniref:desulfoferrodoxin family protein n=1 Tax=Telmatospirillum sp. TaxID=2079197 RepID=UPI00386EF164